MATFQPSRQVHQLQYRHRASLPAMTKDAAILTKCARDFATYADEHARQLRSGHSVLMRIYGVAVGILSVTAGLYVSRLPNPYAGPLRITAGASTMVAAASLYCLRALRVGGSDTAISLDAKVAERARRLAAEVEEAHGNGPVPSRLWFRLWDITYPYVKYNIGGSCYPAVARFSWDPECRRCLIRELGHESEVGFDLIIEE